MGFLLRILVDGLAEIGMYRSQARQDRFGVLDRCLRGALIKHPIDPIGELTGVGSTKRGPVILPAGMRIVLLMELFRSSSDYRTVD
ncbi:MAG: hypothetical protein R3E82_10150 [Pseudomonadales bacterium]